MRCAAGNLLLSGTGNRRSKGSSADRIYDTIEEREMVDSRSEELVEREYDRGCEDGG